MLHRRNVLTSLAALSIGTPALHRAVAFAVQQEDGVLTKDALANAQWICGLELSEEEQASILNAVNKNTRSLAPMRELAISELQSPPFHFKPLTHHEPVLGEPDRSIRLVEDSAGELPESDEAIAFLSVSELSPLLRSRKLTSRKLTEIYLTRLKKYGPMLRCVVSLLEESALQRADEMDAEISAGKYRGPLHGIPWGAKDLIDIEGTKTTWGIPFHENRESETTATVAERLQNAGTVLVAKLSLGALAMGDKWFRGMTRNPWNPVRGSSGSSAGSASAVVAGLVGFTLGSETLGSITSPSRVCGATGFRPTFGRVSRHGCMPLSWTMDKIGPICRSAEDCAIVFNTIHGADGRDESAYSYPFRWPQSIDFRKLRIGYSGRRKIERSPTLKHLKELGCELVEFELPSFDSLYTMATIIDIEAASVFDRLLRDGHTEGWNTWPGSFRSAQFISAVDYLRIQRHRVELMEAFEERMKDIDVLVNVRDVFHTNLTGHPSIVLPTAYRERKSGGITPVCSTVTGKLGEDDRLLAFAFQLQNHFNAHLQHPQLDSWLEKFDSGALDPKSEEPEKNAPENDAAGKSVETKEEAAKKEDEINSKKERKDKPNEKQSSQDG